MPSPTYNTLLRCRLRNKDIWDNVTTNSKYLMGVLIGGPLSKLETRDSRDIKEGGTRDTKDTSRDTSRDSRKTGDIGEGGPKGDCAWTKDVVNLVAKKVFNNLMAKYLVN